jgi:hypothetical protein
MILDVVGLWGGIRLLFGRSLRPAEYYVIKESGAGVPKAFT